MSFWKLEVSDSFSLEEKFNTSEDFFEASNVKFKNFLDTSNLTFGNFFTAGNDTRRDNFDSECVSVNKKPSDTFAEGNFLVGTGVA